MPKDASCTTTLSIDDIIGKRVKTKTSVDKEVEVITMKMSGNRPINEEVFTRGFGVACLTEKCALRLHCYTLKLGLCAMPRIYHEQRVYQSCAKGWPKCYQVMVPSKPVSNDLLAVVMRTCACFHEFVTIQRRLSQRCHNSMKSVGANLATQRSWNNTRNPTSHGNTVICTS